MRDWLSRIRRNETSSLKTQIREALAAAILEGTLSETRPVPSPRRMAEKLGVSRNTVVLAYQGLLEDGYLIARERSGYYVSSRTLAASPQYKLPLPQPRLAPAKRARDHSTLWRGRLRAKPAQLATTSKPPEGAHRYPFVRGQADYKLFPLAEWRECAKQALGKRGLAAHTAPSPTSDDPLLVEQLRRRILPQRGISASEEQILVTMGVQNTLFLLCGLLVGRGTRVAMEDPGHPGVRNLLALARAKLSFVPVDQGGLDPERLPARLEVAFTAPGHQIPTAAVMPAERRLAILAAAKNRDFVVIEYDCNFETAYDEEPPKALMALDEEGRVIHAGSLSGSLLPGLRLGFLVSPKRLIGEARALLGLIGGNLPYDTQRTAALFLAEGHHDGFVRKLRRAYRKRWEIVSSALGRYLPDFETTPPRRGASVWVKGPEGFDSGRLAVEAAGRGVLIEPGPVYFADAPLPCNSFTLGFSSIDESRIEPGIRLLAETVANIQSGS